MSSNGNDFDRTVDQIATFFKGAAAMQQVVKEMGLDKPAPKTEFGDAKNLFEAWSKVFGKRKTWAELDRDTQYRWLEVVKVQKGL